MACEHFDESREANCRVVVGRHVPSVFEREQYCRGESGRCPTLRLYRLSGARLPVAAYWRLWLPLGAEESHAPLPAPAAAPEQQDVHMPG